MPDSDQPSAGPSQTPMGFTLRTTAAALLALAVAQSLGIHHPWWAAMTVWLVSQPTRGLLLERSLARLVGTICGAFAGALILGFLTRDWLVALTAVAAWLALCAGLGSVFRHFRNYGFVLAGYTAAIVVLFGLGDGHSDPGLALDRVLCTVVGILSSTLVSFHVLPIVETGLATREEDVLRRALLHVEEFLLGRAQQATSALVSEIGALDRVIDEYAAGSFHRRREAMRVHHVSGLLLELIALTALPQRSGTVASLTLEVTDSMGERVQRLTAAVANIGQSAMADVLGELARVLNPGDKASQVPIKLDFDPASAWRAAARPIFALTIAAALWQSTGWQTGAMMVMTAALFTSLFSSHDRGNQLVTQVLLGTLFGALAGIAARLFLLPHVAGLLPTLLCITPFLFVGAWLMRRPPATSKMAIDLIMTFLLTAQPGSAATSAALTLNEAAALIAGVLIAAATLWLILPATPGGRRCLLARRIVRLTMRVATSPSRTAAEEARRSLRIAQVRLLDSTKADTDIFSAAQACLAAVSEALAAARNNGSATLAETPSPHLRTPNEMALQASAALADLITLSRRRNSQ